MIAEALIQLCKNFEPTLMSSLVCQRMSLQVADMDKLTGGGSGTGRRRRRRQPTTREAKQGAAPSVRADFIINGIRQINTTQNNGFILSNYSRQLIHILL